MLSVSKYIPTINTSSSFFPDKIQFDFLTLGMVFYDLITVVYFERIFCTPFEHLENINPL